MPMTDPSKQEGAAANGIGARLQAARGRAGLSVPQAAERLHLDPAVIEALEKENFAALGADVYIRGHMRHYAMLVKESVPELLALYGSSAPVGAAPDLTMMPHAKPSSSFRAALLLTGLAVVIGVGLIGSIRWIYLDLHPPAAAASTSCAGHRDQHVCGRVSMGCTEQPRSKNGSRGGEAPPAGTIGGRGRERDPEVQVRLLDRGP